MTRESIPNGLTAFTQLVQLLLQVARAVVRLVDEVDQGRGVSALRLAQRVYIISGRPASVVAVETSGKCLTTLAAHRIMQLWLTVSST